MSDRPKTDQTHSTSADHVSSTTPLSSAVLLLSTLAIALPTTWPVTQMQAQEPTAPSAAHQLFLAPSATAQQTPRNQRWFPIPVNSIRGQILELNDKQAKIQVPGKVQVDTYAANRVIHVRLANTPDDQIKALALYDQRQFSAALPAIVKAVSEPQNGQRAPVWRQQWLSMLAARAAMHGNRGSVAIELVRQLDQRPLPAMTLGLLPIVWDWSDTSALVQPAVKAAGSDSLAVKLVAASWLMRSQDYRDAAKSALQRLAAQTQRPTIATLAKQLLWQLKTPVQIQSDFESWETEVEALPMPLQTGPIIGLATTLRRMGQNEASQRWSKALELAAPAPYPVPKPTQPIP